MSNIKYKMSNLNQLAWRNLMEHRTRTALSVLAIALGVATIIASSMTSQAIINAIAGSDALSYMQGIIDQLGDTMQMVGVGIGLVAGFMIFNAFLMSVTQRRQQIGALRSLGMTRGQVMRLVLAEALAMALIGTGVGVVAGPLMETGCGALVASAIASRNGAGLGDTITVTGANGPVECTIAGIGSPMANASILSLAALEDFGAPDPVGVSVWPGNTADAQALRADVEAAISGYPALQITEVEGLYELQVEMFDTIPLLFNALLLLAVVAAALGVVNTTLISVGERKREIGLLRAVGATRRQVVTVVVGEAALMGLAGGVIGLAAGVGFTLMVVLVYGGNAWGAPDLDLWGAAWRSAQPALASGAAGLVIAPIVSALAAYFPARAALRGSAIEMLRAAGI